MATQRFRDFSDAEEDLSEAKKVGWKKTDTGERNKMGKPILDWETADGKYKLELTGYHQFVGRSHSTNPNHTSWMITDQTTGKPFNQTFTNIGKAKKQAESMYEVKESVEDLDLLDEEDLDENSKTLSITQRRKAGRRFKRLRTRMKVAKKRALNKTANPTVLKKRAKRSVRATLFKKFAKGKGKADTGMARRAGIERRINRLSPQRIKALTTRQIRTTRKTDRARRGAKKK